MRRIKGMSSRELLQEYSQLNTQGQGRHLRARGFFVASSGAVTDEAIIEYIRTQDITNEDGDFGRPTVGITCGVMRPAHSAGRPTDR
jgi:putative transposase